MLKKRTSTQVQGLALESTIMPMVTDPTPAARAGADLKAARERLGLSLQDIAHHLRIRVLHLEALEDGRISLLPGHAYALAFARSYASALGLDADEVVRRFKAEPDTFGQHTELAFPAPVPEQGLPAGALLLLGFVMAIGLYAGWYRLSGEGRLPVEAVIAIPERLAPLAEQALPPARGPASQIFSMPGASSSGLSAEMSAAAGSATLAASASPRSGLQADPAPPVLAFSPGSAAAAQVPARPTGEPQAAIAAAVPGQAPDTSVPPAQDAGRILLAALADTWMLVKDRSGAVLLNRTLRAGETWTAPARSDLVLTTGNAGGTEILVDGVAAPVPGGHGAVRREIALDPDQLKDGLVTSASAPQRAAKRPRQ